MGAVISAIDRLSAADSSEARDILKSAGLKVNRCKLSGARWHLYVSTDDDHAAALLLEANGWTVSGSDRARTLAGLQPPTTPLAPMRLEKCTPAPPRIHPDPAMMITPMDTGRAQQVAADIGRANGATIEVTTPYAAGAILATTITGPAYADARKINRQLMETLAGIAYDMHPVVYYEPHRAAIAAGQWPGSRLYWQLTPARVEHRRKSEK